MNNFGILKDLLENHADDLQLNNKLIIALLVFIGINLITTLVNIFSQHRLKSKDKKNISFKIKEEKRIDIFEGIYQQLEALSFYGKEDFEQFLNSLQETERYISYNKLHIDKNELNVMYKITDYYKTVIADFRKKDYNNEITLFQKLADLYNK